MPAGLYGTGIYGVDTYGPDGPEVPAAVWEEVYGHDYPLTQDDVPVLENGICRVRYEKDQAAFSIDAYNGGEWVEQGRVAFWQNEPDGTEFQIDIFNQPLVLEWTPERAVIGAIFHKFSSGARCVVYITLQRGWTGPRFEAYATWGSGGTGFPGTGVAVRIVPVEPGSTDLGRSSGTAAIVSGTDYGDFAGLEPWAYLLGEDPNLALHLAVLQEDVKLIGRSDTAAYGATRKGVSLAIPATPTIPGYVSATLGIGPRASAAADAETLGRHNLMDCRAVPLLVER